MIERAHLISIATAVPPHRLTQTEAAGRAGDLFAHRLPDFGRIARVFGSTGIESRYLVKPIEWYLEPVGWPERTAAYLEGAQDLFVVAADKAMAAAGCRASDIDTIVTISSTGIATPSLEARVARHMGFRSDVERVPLDIMGWKIEDRGLGVIFDRDIPPFAERKVGRPAVDGILDRLGIARGAVDRFTCHPGGAKVITALESSLHLEQGALDHERAVLSAYGNMSAPTIMFVLERVVAAGMPRRTALAAMGPGFSCRVMSLARAA